MEMSSPFRTDVLSGKRILVSGGGSGLGREISESFSAYGAHVYICGRREGVLTIAAAEITKKTGVTVTPICCNIRDPESVSAMVGKIWEEGPLTGLVNNAGANFIAPTKTLSSRAYDAIRSTVMDGNFYVTLEVGKRWIENGHRGSIVSNLVTWIWTGSAYVVPAAMAKTALHAMTMSLAVEWGPNGIRVNAVAPGPFPTAGAWEKLNPIPEASIGATQSGQIPLRRFGVMYELCNLMIFLMTDGCDFLTGQTIAIDGAHHLAAPSTFAGLSSLTDEQWDRASKAIRAVSARDKVGRSA